MGLMLFIALALVTLSALDRRARDVDRLSWHMGPTTHEMGERRRWNSKRR
jgi:hypothetical protein